MPRLLFAILLLSSLLYASHDDSIEKVCIELKIIPASKAIIQWKRVFSSESRMKRYHIDKLSPQERDLLEEYLIEHAADSSQPMVPGL